MQSEVKNFEFNAEGIYSKFLTRSAGYQNFTAGYNFVIQGFQKYCYNLALISINFFINS